MIVGLALDGQLLLGLVNEDLARLMAGEPLEYLAPKGVPVIDMQSLVVVWAVDTETLLAKLARTGVNVRESLAAGRALRGAQQAEIDFTLPVVEAADCYPCPDCGEPVCPFCEEHYAECPHPGPHSEREDPE